MSRNSYSVEVRDGKIFELGYPNDPIGVTIKTYNCALDQLDEVIPAMKSYQQLLIDLGKEHGKRYINIPMTQAEQLEQIMATQQQYSERLDSLTASVTNLANILSKKVG